jgi:hypothetical protein
MSEEWKDITEFNGDFQISNLGRIRRATPCIGSGSASTFIGKILKTETTWNGYERVTFYRKDGRHRYLVHRLVAKVFIPNPFTLPYVHHKNHNKMDNIVENLMWCSTEENNNYNIYVWDFLQQLSDTNTYTKKDLLSLLAAMPQ